MKRNLKYLWRNLLLPVACFLLISAGMHAQELLGKIRVLEGGRKSSTAVGVISEFPATNHVLEGSFHEIQPGTTYDPADESDLMNEIFNLLNATKVDLSKAKIINSNTINRGITTSVPTTRISGPVKAPTKSMSKAEIAASANAEIKAANASAAATAYLTLEQVKIKDSKMYIKMLAEMGFIIEGGIIGEGGLWSAEQLQLLYTCLRTLPANFSKSTKNFKRVVDFAGRKTVLGYVYAGIPRVYICNFGVRPTKFEETIVHEMAHNWMFDKANAKAKTEYANTFWPGNKRPVAGTEQPPSIYGSTQMAEDFAEAVRLYWQDCSGLRKTHPKRWEFIRKHVFAGASWTTNRRVASAKSKTLSATKQS